MYCNIAFLMRGVLTNLIWAVQMPGFMLVSGYFANRRVVTLKESGGRICKNAEHYALPFLTWYVGITTLLLGYNDRNVIAGLRGLFMRVDRGLWFLWVVFILSIVATFCNLAMSKGRNEIQKVSLLILNCVASIVFLGVLARLFSVNFMGIKYVLYYAIFYGFGWLIKEMGDWGKKYWERYKEYILFVCLLIFLIIVYNYDLYHCGDDLISIVLRCIAGFTGNAVIIYTLGKYENMISKTKLNTIGEYTLEIYVTHMYVNGLFMKSSQNSFFTATGFANFIVSLIVTIIFTIIIIAVFKSIPAANYLMYGKRPPGSSNTKLH